MRNSIFVLTGVIVGTGSYVVYPAFMYSLIGIVIIIYFYDLIDKIKQQNKASEKYKTYKQNRVLQCDYFAILMYAGLLLINYLRENRLESTSIYFNFFSGFFVYIILIYAIKLNLNSQLTKKSPLISIFVILVGLILELQGIIDFRGINVYGEQIELIRRPGGFLNPNMSAALGLIWLYIAMESKIHLANWQKFVSLLGCVSILSITQSRGAIIFFILYIILKLYENGLKSIKYGIVGFMIFGVVYFFSDLNLLMGVLGNSITDRFHGDGSSVERYSLAIAALDLFAQNPIFGYGMRAMYHIYGLGTHNELIEWGLNFGIMGLFVISFIFYRFYFVSSFKYLFLCILPTLLFSHNFFETTAFQVALAFAFCLRTKQSNLLSINGRIHTSKEHHAFKEGPHKSFFQKVISIKSMTYNECCDKKVTYADLP